MRGLRLFFDPTGRIGRRAFVLCQLGLYLVWIFAPSLLALPAEFGRRGVEQADLDYLKLAAPMLLLLQLVFPYVNICLHLKRLRDAGRGPGSLIAISVCSVAAIPVALMIGNWTLRGQSSVENLNFPIVWFISIALALVAMLVSWFVYGVWVALGTPRAARRRDPDRLAEQFG